MNTLNEPWIAVAFRAIAEYPAPGQDDMPAANMRKIAADALERLRSPAEPAKYPPLPRPAWDAKTIGTSEDAFSAQQMRDHFDLGRAAPTTKAEPAPVAVREDFEAFMQLDTSGFSLEREGEDYKEFEVATYWHFWQACAMQYVKEASPADALDAETALLKVLSAVQRYLPPDGISIDAAMNEIIAAIDPWPVGRIKDES